MHDGDADGACARGYAVAAAAAGGAAGNVRVGSGAACEERALESAVLGTLLYSVLCALCEGGRKEKGAATGVLASAVRPPADTTRVSSRYWQLQQRVLGSAAQAHL